MATQKRASRGSTKKSTASRSTTGTKSTSSARRRAGLKAAPASRRKRSTTASTTATSRSGVRSKGGVIKRAIKKGISELAKVGT